MNKTLTDELDVELKYQILLNNQSATTAIVNSIAYYYDSHLQLLQLQLLEQYLMEQ